MAWSAPMTAVAGQAFTAAQFNQYVRDNLNECPAAAATESGTYFVGHGTNEIVERNMVEDFVNPQEATSSTSFTDLGTFGPSVTLETGSRALVGVKSQGRNSTRENVISYEISGATERSPSDSRSLILWTDGTGYSAASFVDAALDLIPGANTFTLKYRTVDGTGEFRRRLLWVLPF